jgi:hypothetical protein
MPVRMGSAAGWASNDDELQDFSRTDECRRAGVGALQPYINTYLDGVGLPARAPPITPARPHPQQQFDMDSDASAA